MFKTLIAAMATTALVLPAAASTFPVPWCNINATSADGLSGQASGITLDKVGYYDLDVTEARSLNISGVGGLYPGLTPDNAACTATWSNGETVNLKFGNIVYLPEGVTLASWFCYLDVAEIATVTVYYGLGDDRAFQNIPVLPNGQVLTGQADDVRTVAFTELKGVDAEGVSCTFVWGNGAHITLPLTRGANQHVANVALTQVSCAVNQMKRAQAERDIYDHRYALIDTIFVHDSFMPWSIPLDGSSQPFTMQNLGEVKEVRFAEASLPRVTCVSTWATAKNDTRTVVFDASRCAEPPSDGFSLKSVSCNANEGKGKLATWSA